MAKNLLYIGTRGGWFVFQYSKVLRCKYFGERKNSCGSKFVQLLLSKEVNTETSKISKTKETQKRFKKFKVSINVNSKKTRFQRLQIVTYTVKSLTLLLVTSYGIKFFTFKNSLVLLNQMCWSPDFVVHNVTWNPITQSALLRKLNENCW
jgi:hypothetical protein